MKNTAKKQLKTSKAKWKSFLMSKTTLWLAVLAICIYGWSIIDTPLGTGIPTKGLVTGYQFNAKSQKMAVIEMRDKSVIRKTGVFAPIGGYIDCMRYEKKYLPTESYECP